MKAKIISLLTVLTVMAALMMSCDPQSNDLQVAERSQGNVMDRAIAQAPAYLPRNFPAREDINWYLRETETRDTWYVYAINRSGTPMFYVVSDMKPRNICISITSPDRRVANSAGAVTLSAPALDGVYYGGAGCDAYYLRDVTTGNFIELARPDLLAHLIEGTTGHRNRPLTLRRAPTLTMGYYTRYDLEIEDPARQLTIEQVAEYFSPSTELPSAWRGIDIGRLSVKPTLGNPGTHFTLSLREMNTFSPKAMSISRDSLIKLATEITNKLSYSEEEKRDRQDHQRYLSILSGEDTTKWYEFATDMKRMSLKWPAVLFKLGREGESSDDRNGRAVSQWQTSKGRSQDNLRRSYRGVA